MSVIMVPPGQARRLVKAGVPSHASRIIFEDIFGNIFDKLHDYRFPSALSGHNNFRRRLFGRLTAGRDFFVARNATPKLSRGYSRKKSRGQKHGSGPRDLIGSKRPYLLVSKVGPDRVDTCLYSC